MVAEDPIDILALDLGSAHVGWAFGRSDAPAPRCGTVHPKGDDAARFCVSFADWLHRMVQFSGAREIVQEGMVPPQTFKQVHVVERMVGTSIVLKMYAFRRSLIFSEASAMTVRKFVVGTGRADDGQVMSAVLSLGAIPDSAHAADAAALWYYRLRRKRVRI